jgi:predicted HAD superfamily phosphohydrolase
MKAKVSAGTVIFHNWDPVQGLVEQEIVFDSIDELFARCLEIRAGKTVDRVVLDGVDQEGMPRRLTLAFQSASVSALPPE